MRGESLSLDRGVDPPQDSRSISVEHIAHRFAGTGWLFEDLSAVISPNRMTVVTGPSGCGKSTMLSLLAGWESPTRGTIRRVGVVKVGWVFQNPHGVAHRLALDHVAFPFLCRGLRRHAAETEARDVLERFGLGTVANREFAALSGGEAQRLMLARAVATAPDLLLVDEPTAQLDRAMAASVTATLVNLVDEDTLLVVATHDADVRARASDVIDLVSQAPEPQIPPLPTEVAL